MAARRIPDRDGALSSVGRQLPGVEVAIFDDQEQPVAEGGVGRIWVKGPSITKGYWESPELTANMIHGEWMDTGDLGFFYEGELIHRRTRQGSDHHSRP